MRRRRRRNVGDSFDLFLDTITNTFGGVLLITLLIVLLIRDNTRDAPQQYQASTMEDSEVVESEIESLEAEKKTLAANLEIKTNLIRDFENPDARELLERLADLMNEINQLEAAQAQLSLETKSVANSLQGLEAEQQQLQQDLAAKTAEYEKLSKQLQAEVKARTRTMALPQETRTVKAEVPVIVKDNQVFFVNKSRTPGSFVLNTDHFARASSRDVEIRYENQNLKTIPGKGIPIDISALNAEFRNYSANNIFFAFVVRSDSFAEFNKIRESAVGLGFEYRIVPTDEVIGQGSTAPVKTQ